MLSLDQREDAGSFPGLEVLKLAILKFNENFVLSELSESSVMVEVPMGTNPARGAQGLSGMPVKTPEAKSCRIRKRIQVNMMTH